jgi:methyltransferase (TIGR00027 family)
MTERRASKTALLVAAYRARASRRDPPLISDPWAATLAGAEGEALAAAVDAFLVDRELWLALRVAFIDAEVAHWSRAEPDMRQVVILGAGLDTRAARFAHPGVRFFEVDHPASQADKLARLATVPGYPIDCATYVACDFEHDDFVDRLVAAGFDAASPALVVWEGVSYYLPEAAVRATLRRTASALHPRSILVFDHFLKRFVDASARPAKDAKAAEFVDGLGEQFLWGTNDPLPMLHEEGFRHLRSVSFDEICLSLTGTYDRKREFRFQRICVASPTVPKTR